MPEMIKVDSYGESYNCSLLISEYEQNNNMAIMLIEETGEPFADVTVNLEPLAPGFAYLDTNGLKGVDDIVNKYKIAKPTGITRKSGWCEYPLYEFDLDELRKYAHRDSDYYLI